MNPTVRIIDKDFNFLGEIDNFLQLVFTKKFVAYGEFEMQIEKSVASSRYLQIGNIIYLDENRAGIIEYVEINQDAEKELITVQGYTLEKLLNRRITLPHSGKAEWKLEAPFESVIKSLVTFNLGQLATAERIISEIVIADNLARGGVITFSSAYKQLDEEVKALCLNNAGGICVKLDTALKKFVFDVVFGMDRTVNQNVNPPVIFSAEFDNVLDQALVQSEMDYKNTAVTGGKGEGANREIILVYEDNKPISGLNRREIFADIRDSNVTSAMLPQKGLERLQENPKILSLDGKINPYHSLKYGSDFYLGDIVTRVYGNAVVDTRITEVTESYDSSGYKLECVFGNKMPTILDKIKNGVRNL